MSREATTDRAEDGSGSAAAVAPTSGGRLEGKDCVYVLWQIDDIAQIPLCIDMGWLGMASSSRTLIELAAVSEPRRNVVCIVSLPPKGIVLGYALVMGAAVERASLKDSVRRDIPPHWDCLVRGAFIRVSQFPFSEVAGEANTVLQQEADIFLKGGAPHAKWLSVSQEVGAALCSQVDESAKKLLPRDLRSFPSGGRGAGERGGDRGGGGRPPMRYNNSHQQAPPPPQQQQQYGGYPPQQMMGYAPQAPAPYFYQGYSAPQPYPPQQQQQPQPPASAMPNVAPVDLNQFPNYEAYAQYMMQVQQYYAYQAQAQAQAQAQQQQGGAQQYR